MKNKYGFKKIISLLLAVILLLSTVGCSSQKEQPVNEEKTEVTTDIAENNKEEITSEENKDEEETSVPAKDEEEKEEPVTSPSTTKPENEKPTKAEAEEALRMIIDLEFETDSEAFWDYDIGHLVDYEFECLEKDNYLKRCDRSIPPISYRWYNNGVIDQEALYKQLITKTRLNGITIDSEIEKIAREVPKASQQIVTYLINNYPDFPLNQALFNLDSLHVDKTDVEYAVGMYSYTENELTINFDNVRDQQDFEKVVAHELFHMFLEKWIDLRVFASANNYDSFRTPEYPLSQVYLEEWYVEYFACSAIDFEPAHLWTVREKLIVDILCASAGVDYTYFERIVLGLDDEKLLNAVEPELRSRAFVYSTLHAFDFGNNYSIVPDGYNEKELRAACLDYALFNLYKNAYVRNIKGVINGEITYEQASEDIAHLENAVWKVYRDDISVNIECQISDMDAIFRNICSQYA